MEENHEVKREKVRSIPIEQIGDFPDHPFKIQDDEQMQKLIESIQKYGVITPVVARKIGGDPEMIDQLDFYLNKVIGECVRKLHSTSSMIGGGNLPRAMPR